MKVVSPRGAQAAAAASMPCTGTVCVCVSVRPSVRPSVFCCLSRSVSLSFLRLSVCVCVCVSVCLSVCLQNFLSVSALSILSLLTSPSICDSIAGCHSDGVRQHKAHLSHTHSL